MKQFLNLTCVFLFLLIASGLISAQDFTVKVPSTFDYSNTIKPLKAGGNLQFQINVKNNRLDTCTISIRKSDLGVVESWISIENNSLVLFPAQSGSFELTINVPSSAFEGVYSLFLKFNGIDKKNNNHTFDGNTQSIIIDNSNPIPPSFSIIKTSTTVTAYSWSSWDSQSSWYTNVNSSSGINGIKSYTVVLKNPDGTIKESKPFEFNGDNSYKFQGLLANSNYTVNVTATDLVGNSNTSSQLATTPPAAPIGLSVLNTGYCSASFSWTASAGATSYNVYKTSSSSPISTIGTSFTFNELAASSSYEMYVEAVGIAGKGDRSKIVVTTLAVPTPLMLGTTVVCTQTFTQNIKSIPEGCSVLWNSSSNLTLLSSSGTSATFKFNGIGSGTVNATFTTCGGTGALSQKSIWYGKPSFASGGSVSGPSQLTPGLVAAYSITPAVGASNYNWQIPSGCYYNYCWQIKSGQNTPSIQVQAGSVGNGAVQCTVSNTCGTDSRYMYVNVQDPHDPDPCDNLMLSISPNPSLGGDVVINVIYPPDPCDDALMSSTSATLSIIDNNGNQFYSKKHQGDRIEISGLNLKNGIYHIIYTKANKKFEKTMIVE